MDKELLSLLTVIYRKLDKIERKLNGTTLSASDKHYLDELVREANKIKDQIV